MDNNDSRPTDGQRQQCAGSANHLNENIHDILWLHLLREELPAIGFSVENNHLPAQIHPTSDLPARYQSDKTRQPTQFSQIIGQELYVQDILIFLGLTAELSL